MKLTDIVVKALPPPSKGNRIWYDSDCKGFGCRVTAAGARSFILNYRTRAGRERRFTIGQFPDWKTTVARAEAGELKRRIDVGEDPLADVHADREAPSVGDWCQRYIAEHLPKKRPSSRRNDLSAINKYILPVLGSKTKVADLSFTDIDRLHQKISREHPYRANRIVALLSKMFALAIRWGWRADNPARGIEKHPETKRDRYLSPSELQAFGEALDGLEDVEGATILRLLLLTGARRGEVLAARWQDFDLEAGIWTKPAATTKQKKLHRLPLSGPARLLLSELRKNAGPDAEFLFSAPGARGHRIEIRRAFRAACKAAGITGLRVHDLRHSHASVLAGAGLSLPIIGALLGHTQPSTTARYSHLFDDPLRRAAETAGAIITGKSSAEIVSLKGDRRG